VGPQVGSCILLFFFYMTDFQMVSFIPKTAFSSLLVLGFLDMMDSWFIKSYYRTKVCHYFLSVFGVVSFRP
jgi:MFS superfamily sulfate permease-like transporter